MAAIVDVEVTVPENGPNRLLAITELGGLVNSANLLEDSDIGDTDSGHWSVDYDFPCSDLTNEELVSEFSCANSTTSGSSRTSLNGTATPSIKSCQSLSSVMEVRSERVDPLEPDVALLEAEPEAESLAKLPEIEENLCIVCFDPEVIEGHYDYYDYDHYYDEYTGTQPTSSHLTLPCCKKPLCKECMRAIVQVNVNEGRVQILCPHPECGKPLPKSEVTQYMSAEIKAKYERFLVDMDGDSRRKTCPNCCEITEHHIKKSGFHPQEKDLKITCKLCDFEWCFHCHAPWHTGLSCRNFRKGDKYFRKWTKGKNEKGINNCQKCPTCRVWIERSSGCNHMTCGRCHTHFCYYCGKRFLELGIIDHDSDLNVWGCDRNLLPNRPALRKFVRSSYLGVKISYLAGYPTLLVGAAVLLVVGGAVALPIYGGYKLYRLNQYRRKNNRRKRHH